MKVSRRGVLYALSFIVLATGVPGYLLYRVAASERSYVLRTSADRLMLTTIVPHLESPIPAGRNVIWCASLQLAWNRSCEVFGADIRIVGDPVEVASLNRKLVTLKDIDEDSCLVMCGKTSDGIQEAIRNQTKARFPGERGPFLSQRELTADIKFVVYALILKHLEFAVPFEDLQNPLVFEGRPVRNFGIIAGSPYSKPVLKEACKQVLIHDYKTPDDFVIELATKSEGDRLIMAKLPFIAGDLLVTVRQVMTRLNKKPNIMVEDDTLRIPRIHFDLTKDFDELKGRIILPGGIQTDLLLLEAIQNIRFSLDEKGAQLRSEARLGFGCGGPARPKYNLVFDKPFLLVMKRAESELPYFILWVANPELLAPKS